MEWPGWVLAAYAKAQPWLEKLAFWRGYEAQMESLILIGVGIAIYTGLVFSFYQSISKRDAFHSGAGEGWVARIIAFLESVLVFPVMSFLYLMLLTFSLFFLAKESRPTEAILLFSMAIVVSVRLVSSFSEEASVDLAKLLPLGLLGVQVVDPQEKGVSILLQRMGELPAVFPVLWRYFAFFIVMEALLRTFRKLKRRLGARAGKTPKRHQLARQIQPTRTLPVKEGSRPGAGPAAEDLDPALRQR